MSTEDDETRRRALSTLLPHHDFAPPSAAVRVEFGACSAQGRASRNEDHYLIIRFGREQETLATSLSAADVPRHFAENGYAMLVADGLGQPGAGSMASRVALSTIAHMAQRYGKWTMRIDPTTAADLFERAEWFYNRADEAVVAMSLAHPALAGMATALTATYSVGSELFVAHVGHTRAYLFRDGALTLLTRDHTVERHHADVRTPVAIERRGQDLRHILTDAVGATADPPLVEVERFALQSGDSVLLCSNGLTDALSEDRIADVLCLRRGSMELCEALVSLATAVGDDDVTVVLAQYQMP